MKFLFSILFISFQCSVYCQAELLKKNKVRKIVQLRERFLPNRIKKEIYNSFLFDIEGRIIEKTENYSSPQRETFGYDSSGNLIMLESEAKLGKDKEMERIFKEGDINLKNDHIPEFYNPGYVNWGENLEYTVSSKRYMNEGREIDTILKGKRTREIIIYSYIKDTLRASLHYTLSGNRIKSYSFRKYKQREATETHLQIFNKAGYLKYKRTLLPFTPYQHVFRYKYYKTGIIRKVLSYDKEKELTEISWYKIEYF